MITCCFNVMRKVCAICGKTSNLAGGYSNRVRATKYNPTGKRLQKPNLQWARNPRGDRMLVCTKCLKKPSLIREQVVS